MRLKQVPLLFVKNANRLLTETSLLHSNLLKKKCIFELFHDTNVTPCTPELLRATKLVVMKIIMDEYVHLAFLHVAETLIYVIRYILPDSDAQFTFQLL